MEYSLYDVISFKKNVLIKREGVEPPQEFAGEFVSFFRITSITKKSAAPRFRRRCFLLLTQFLLIPIPKYFRFRYLGLNFTKSLTEHLFCLIDLPYTIKTARDRMYCVFIIFA